MEPNQTKHGPDTSYLSTTLNIIERDIIRAVNMQSKDFEDNIEASMDNLELEVDAAFPTDSESENTDDPPPTMHVKHTTSCTKTSLSSGVRSPRPKNDARYRTNSSSSTDSSISQSDLDEVLVTIAPVSSSDPFRSPEHIGTKVFAPTFLMPFQERRRLSQCKEEDEEEERTSKQITGVRHKFIVTKTSDVQARPEAKNLVKMTAKQNAATIHFPCSSANQRSSVQDVFFSPQHEINPHMDRRYFDTSLVEIRSHNTSTRSLGKSNEHVDGNVWVPRSKNIVSTGLSVSWHLMCYIFILFTFLNT